MASICDIERDKLRECFELSARNMEFLTQNYDRLAKEHDRKWVAISDGQVVEASDNIEELRQRIRKYKHPECIVTEYVTTEPVAMFF